MVKSNMPINERKELAIAIKKNYQAGMKAVEISRLFKISKQTVNYWLHHPIIIKRKRRTKLTRPEINIIIKWARDKPINICSAKKIRNRFNLLPKRRKEKGKQKKISLSTANKTLNKYVSKPKQMRKVFYLNEKKKDQRLKFLLFMKEHNITPEDIFFTDESIINLSSYFGRNNKIRISRRTQKYIKNGNESALSKINREFHKKSNGLMISGGICKEGLGQIIFHSGNVNSFAYKQVLNFYKDDIRKFGPKFFQQDGATAHSSLGSKEEIKKLFGDLYIPTWEEGPKVDGKTIPKWPPSSPDLSAFELIWSIIKGMLNLFPPKTVEDLKSSIKKIWESIPTSICERIIAHIKKRWELCIKHKGRRLDKELLRKLAPNKNEINWKIKNATIEGIRISYNDKFVLKLKEKDIRERNRKLDEQREKENNAKIKLDKLLKLKPKEYKNISEREKNETNFLYLYEKGQREVIEEDIKKIEKMTALEYLDILNKKTKEKLIGLCLDKSILDSIDNSTNADDDEEYEEEDEISQ